MADPISAILKQKQDGTFGTVYISSKSDICFRPDGTTVENFLVNHTHTPEQIGALSLEGGTIKTPFVVVSDVGTERLRIDTNVKVLSSLDVASQIRGYDLILSGGLDVGLDATVYSTLKVGRIEMSANGAITSRNGNLWVRGSSRLEDDVTIGRTEDGMHKGDLNVIGKIWANDELDVSGSTTFSGLVRPSGDGAIGLGTSSSRFNTLYTKKVDASEYLMAPKIQPPSTTNKLRFMCPANATPVASDKPLPIPWGGTGASNGVGLTLFKTCAIDAAIAAKVVDADTSYFSLSQGVRIGVLFTAGNTASAPSLNVGGTGALAIVTGGNSTPKAYNWPANSYVEFTYNGTFWVISGGDVVGQAGTAMQFHDAKTVSLTGDVTGSASSVGGWSIATNLKNSGATAGTYGSNVRTHQNKPIAAMIIRNSNIMRQSTTAHSVFTAKVAGTLAFNYQYASEANYDKVTMIIGGTVVLSAVGGTINATAYSKALTVGQTVDLTYVKDGSNNTGYDGLILSDLYYTVGSDKIPLTPENFCEFFDVKNDAYYFAPRMVINIPQLTVTAKGIITSVVNKELEVPLAPFIGANSGSGGGVDIQVGSSQPINQSAGDLWFQTL